MLWDEIKKIKSGPKELKEFGVTFGIFFLLLAGLIFWMKQRLDIVLPALSAVFFALAFLRPGWLKPFQKIWMGLALVIGWCVSHVILALLFFLAVTPIALVLRMRGKRFMETKIDRSAASYWHPREKREYDPRSCETQY
jgi:Zn-dependent protease with chaperone function